MILVAFTWIVFWALASTLLCVIGCLLTWSLQGSVAATDLAAAWLSTFNGILVGAAGYGAVWFICRERHQVVKAVDKVLDVPDGLRDDFGAHLDRLRSWRATHAVAIAMTIVGGFIAYNAGIPLSGFSHVYLTIAVISYYYVGAHGVMVFVALLQMFRFVEANAGPDVKPRISLKVPLQRRDLQTIDLYFVISSAMAIFAVYVCFRTTLTAFHGAPAVYYKAMIIPVLFFLPAALVYSFYPRWVLRQVWEADTFVAVEDFAEKAAAVDEGDFKESLNMKKLILELKEKMLSERRAAPLFTLKDAPTLTMAILMLLQLVAQKDPILSDYFTKAFK
jgi:hypothetical protein